MQPNNPLTDVKISIDNVLCSIDNDNNVQLIIKLNLLYKFFLQINGKSLQISMCNLTLSHKQLLVKSFL